MQKNLLWMLVAAGLVTLVGCAQKEVGMIVIYAVDADKARSRTEMSDAEMGKLLAAIDRRLTRGSRKLGRVRQLDDQRIEVSIFRAEVNEMQRVADLLPRPGTLEFRILANSRDHQVLIEEARKSDAQFVYFSDVDGKTQRDKNDEPVRRGWWVPLSEDKGRNNPILNYPEIATRTRQLGESTITEVLVAKDPYDVTGAYLVRSAPGIDQSGRPTVTFTFNTSGGQLFGGLTGENLPNPGDGFTRKLGIIVDGCLVSAPAIQSQIMKQGQITGNFSKQEVEDLVHVLNTGMLPVAIRQVERRVIEIEK